MKIKKEELKKLLDNSLNLYGPEYIKDDPIVFVHQYEEKQDKEVVGLISALMALGSVRQIKSSLTKLLLLLGSAPAIALEEDKLYDRVIEENIYHRFFDAETVRAFLLSIRDVLREGGSLKELFVPRLKNLGIKRGIEEVSTVFNTYALRYSKNERKLNLLFASPLRGSACKRWMLYLRWMVRRGDGIDLGLWDEISPSQLIIPVDVHIFRISRKLGLTGRMTVSWRTAEEITESLRNIDPFDPVKYDFALMRLDMFELKRKKVQQS